ncbi:MAG: hypothetical protein QF416_10475 [Candidatus Marinimicrobia bacterium]|nr:hypothetical protein [Candidatus Neomarinimicrobiota bacterium]MDP7060883.1 hypothetical protein [Candidatus Neomarinimicrobiota bacterium]
MKINLTPLVITVLTLCTCTKNPFNNNGSVSDHYSIKGIVELEDGENPESLYVWLEIINIGTWTDTTGQFILSLPHTGSSEGGQNGQFSLYAYAANYQHERTIVKVIDGQFVPGEGGLDNKGELRAPLTLGKRLNISTTVMPSILEPLINQTAEVTVTLNPLDQQVTVQSRRAIVNRATAYTGLFIVNENEEVVHKEDIESARMADEPVGINVKTWVIPMDASSSNLAPGEYSVVPYLLVKSDAPPGLLESMGKELLEFSPDYLRLPMKRKDGTITITDG